MHGQCCFVLDIIYVEVIHLVTFKLSRHQYLASSSRERDMQILTVKVHTSKAVVIIENNHFIIKIFDFQRLKES